MVVSSIISNNSEDVKFDPPISSVVSTTHAATNESDNFHYAREVKTTNQSNQQNPLNNIIINATSIDSKKPQISNEDISSDNRDTITWNDPCFTIVLS